jgi:heme A synthase
MISAVPHASSSRLARFAWGVLAFNLFVILWGAFVRATGSGAGCGSHWPLCNGQVVPRDPALATLIEFGHRVTSGIDLLLVAALVIGTWRTFPRGHRARLGAGLSALFLVSEALVGAGLVLFEMVADNASLARAYWISGHLVNTYLLLASLTLTVWWASAAGAGDVSPQGSFSSEAPHPDPLPTGRGHLHRSAALLVAVAGLLVLGVSGAVTALGDTLFPVSSLAEAQAQNLPDTAELFIGLRVWHPTLAFVVGVWLAGAVLAASSGRNGAHRPLAIGIVVLYLAQILVGGLNWWLLAPVGLQLAHLLVSDLIWIALILLTVRESERGRGSVVPSWSRGQ